MKKSIKILITSCIAAVGVGASFGGAFALYYRNATTAEFDIGTYTHTTSGNVTYKLGDVYSSLGEQKVDFDHNNFTLKVALGGVYSNDIPAQSNVYGNLAVTANIDAKLVDHVKWSVWIENYADGTYWGNWDNGARKLTDGNVALEAAETTVQKNLAVKAVENPVYVANPDEEHPQIGQVLAIYVEFPELSEENFLEYAGATYNFSIDFGEPVDVDIPIIKGDGNGWSSDAKEYRMVPNINNTDNDGAFQWSFENLTGFAKFYIHDEKSDGTTYYVKTVDGNDVEINNTETYSVYYYGSSGETGDRQALHLDEEHHVIYQ